MSDELQAEIVAAIENEYRNGRRKAYPLTISGMKERWHDAFAAGYRAGRAALPLPDGTDVSDREQLRTLMQKYKLHDLVAELDEIQMGDEAPQVGDEMSYTILEPLGENPTPEQLARKGETVTGTLTFVSPVYQAAVLLNKAKDRFGDHGDAERTFQEISNILAPLRKAAPAVSDREDDVIADKLQQEGARLVYDFPGTSSHDLGLMMMQAAARLRSQPTAPSSELREAGERLAELLRSVGNQFARMTWIPDDMKTINAALADWESAAEVSDAK